MQILSLSNRVKPNNNTGFPRYCIGREGQEKFKHSDIYLIKMKGIIYGFRYL